MARVPHETVTYVIGGSKACPHALVDREYLGQMGANAMYHCRGCDGAVILSPRHPDA